MKNFYLPFFFYLGIIAANFSFCTLEKEPGIPTGATNKTDPVFASAAIIPDTNNIFQAKVRLSSPGNLNILQHGWVWSEMPNPTLQDNKLELGRLTIDSFSTEITDLDLGKPYYLRPYISTGYNTYYGPEQCSFLGVDFTINTDTEIFQGAVVQFTNTSAGANTYSWNFGDTSTSSEMAPLHTFNKLGNIIVRLIAYNNGCIATKELSLNIIHNPFEDYWMPIPGGTFMMGCTPEQEPDCFFSESPVHTVTLSPFIIGKTEITQRQWLAVLGNNPSYFYNCGLDCPVETVSWDRITQEFIPALQRKTGQMHRLPTESEWEYAARGGADAASMTKYAGYNILDTVGWYKGNSFEPKLVGKKVSNGYGLYDMSGNVWEWCSDWLGSYTVISQFNPSGPLNGSFRVMRGGSWSNYAEYCRTASRYFNDPGLRGNAVGFRLVFVP